MGSKCFSLFPISFFSKPEIAKCMCNQKEGEAAAAGKVKFNGLLKTLHTQWNHIFGMILKVASISICSSTYVHMFH